MPFSLQVDKWDIFLYLRLYIFLLDFIVCAIEVYVHSSCILIIAMFRLYKVFYKVWCNRGWWCACTARRMHSTCTEHAQSTIAFELRQLHFEDEFSIFLKLQKLNIIKMQRIEKCTFCTTHAWRISYSLWVCCILWLNSSTF